MAERRIWNWGDGDRWRVVESKIRFLPVRYYAQRQVDGRWENISTHRKECTAKAAVEQVIVSEGGEVPPRQEATLKKERAGMLVLTRKSGQQLVLQTADGPVTVINRSRGAIKLALDMPAAVTCLRGELAEQRQASAIDGDSARGEQT